ncbi:MAG: hypothetical protein ACYC6Y_10505 [Thermoguttaceae bacterium]
MTCGKEEAQLPQTDAAHTPASGKQRPTAKRILERLREKGYEDGPDVLRAPGLGAGQLDLEFGK